MLGVLLDFGDKDKNKDGRISDDEKLTSEQRNAQSALLQALVTGLGALTGTDGTELASAVTSAQSEAENNSVRNPDGSIEKRPPPLLSKYDPVALAKKNPALAEALEKARDQGESDEELIARYSAYVDCAGSNSNICKIDKDLDTLSTAYNAAIGVEKEQAEANLVAEQVHSQQNLESAIRSAAGPELAGDTIMDEMIAAGYVNTAAADLPFAEFASQYSGPLTRYIINSGKRPNPVAIAGLLAGGALAITAGSLMSGNDPQASLPGYIPHTPDPKDNITSTPNNGPVISNPLITPVTEQHLPDIITSPPSDLTPKNPGYGNNSPVPQGTVLNNDTIANKDVSYVPPTAVSEPPVLGAILGKPTNGRTTQWELSNGTFEDANQDFDSMKPTNVVDRGNGTRTGTLSDGRHVIVRSISTDGRPTLEIRNPNNNRGTETRYGPKPTAGP